MKNLTIKQKEDQVAEINRAVGIAGSRKELAETMSKITNEVVTFQRVYDYITKGLTPEAAWNIYEASGKKVRLHVLSPVVYAKNKVRPV